jgi:hypothetical protein
MPPKKEALPRVSTSLGLAAPAAEAAGDDGGPASKKARPADGGAPVRAALATFAAAARADAGLTAGPAGSAFR